MSRLAQAVQCLATGWTTGRLRFDPRQRRKDFSSNLCVQTGSGATEPPVQWVPAVLSLGAKAWSGRDADYSHPSSAEVENEQELYLVSPKRLSGVHWDSFSSCFNSCLLLAAYATRAAEIRAYVILTENP
jgi:hypothetical protein